MRLSQAYQTHIIQSFKEHFLPEDHLWLFGSRVYDDKKGGDIDLYIETHYQANKACQARSDFWCDLQKRLGAQKIDVVLKLNDDHHLAIYDVARKEGIILA